MPHEVAVTAADMLPTAFVFFKLLKLVLEQVTSKPQVIDEVDRRLIQLEMEKLSLRKETRVDAVKRVEQIGREIETLKEKQVNNADTDVYLLICSVTIL